MRYLLLSLLTNLCMCTVVYGQADAVMVGRCVIGKITVEGNSVTRRAVILRELSIKEGDVVVRDSVEGMMAENKLRLFNLQLFNEVEQDLSYPHKDTLYWHLRVKERWYIIPTGILQFADRNINTWWTDYRNDYERISAGAVITDRNFRGNLETLALTVQAGYTQKLGITYMLPYINKRQTHGVGVVVAVARSRQTYYTTERDKLVFAGGYSGPVIWRHAEAGLAYLYRPGYASRHHVQAVYRQYEVGDTIRKLNADYFGDSSSRARFVEVNYRYEYNGVDNWNYSLKGEKVVATTVVRAGIEGLKFQSYVTVEAGAFRSLLPSWYVSGIVRGRVMLPQDQPYYFRNGLGSSTDYVRGYEYYVTDGYNYGLLRLNLKRQVYNNTYSLPVRYFTAVPVRVYPKLFFDVGYINSPFVNGNRLDNTVLYSIGAGVDVVTFYDVKVRVEFARNHLGRNGIYLHFNSE